MWWAPAPICLILEFFNKAGCRTREGRDKNSGANSLKFLRNKNSNSNHLTWWPIAPFYYFLLHTPILCLEEFGKENHIISLEYQSETVCVQAQGRLLWLFYLLKDQRSSLGCSLLPPDILLGGIFPNTILPHFLKNEWNVLHLQFIRTWYSESYVIWNFK